MSTIVAVPAQTLYHCQYSTCGRTFNTARGLIAHNTQMHPPKPWLPVKWTQTDERGVTQTFNVEAKESDDPTRPLYQCPRDQSHAPSLSSGAFKKHLRSCYGKDSLRIDFPDAEPRVQVGPSRSVVLRQSETPLPPTPDSDDDYEGTGSEFEPPSKRRRERHSPRPRRSPKKRHLAVSPDPEEMVEPAPAVVVPAPASGRTGPAQGPAAEAQELGPSQQRTFLEDFLSRLSQQTGEDFTRHADVFKEFGMLERHQFRRAQEKPALMAKIGKKLEDRKVSGWAVTNIETFMDEYFAEDRGNDDDGVNP